MNFKMIPIFIISFNRLNDLKQIISRLEEDGYRNLHIIDNASTDKKLLYYLEHIPYQVHFMGKNYGHMVFWQSGIFKDIIESQYYVVTDPDVIPIKECPDDYVEYFYRILNQYPDKQKVGFSLKIDDLPDKFRYKTDVIRWESFFYDKKLSMSPLLFDAEIDTTFALYRPGKIKNFFYAIRTGYPYTARHLGWYLDNENFSVADKTYFLSGEKYGGSFIYESKVKKVRMETIQKLKNLEIDEYAGEIVKLFRLHCDKIYLYGAGRQGHKIAGILEKEKIPFDGFLVTSLDKEKKSFLGYDVMQFDDVKIDKDRDGIVLTMKFLYQIEVMKKLYLLGYKNVCRL